MTKTKLLAAVMLLACTADDRANAEPKKAAKPATPNGPREVAVLGGGCFWGMENVMRDAPGIASIEVGYAGGKSTSVSYEQVSDGDTGHTEAVRIVFDPSVISYDQLLARYYFRGHDPTMWLHQNNDYGWQYRSVIFATTDAQKQEAAAVKARVEKSGKWKKPIVTSIETATTWVRAEEYHQDYLIKHPHGYNDHYMRDFDF
jgi:methionine-S-sulfoxide reductase